MNEKRLIDREELDKMLDENVWTLHRFHHDSIKCGGCNYTTSTTYWAEESRVAAMEKMMENTPDEQEPSGLCGTCMSDLLTGDGIKIVGLKN